MSEARIDHLEGRYAWLERHVVEQDRAVLELAEAVRHLRTELARLQQRAAPSSDVPAAETPDERPPHY